MYFYTSGEYEIQSSIHIVYRFGILNAFYKGLLMEHVLELIILPDMQRFYHS